MTYLFEKIETMDKKICDFGNPKIFDFIDMIFFGPNPHFNFSNFSSSHVFISQFDCRASTT